MYLLRILTTTEKLHCRAPFAEQLFAVHLLVEQFSMADSIKLELEFNIEFNLVDRN